MVLLGLREGSFDRLFPPSINTLATMRFRKGIDPLQRPLPHMPLHHLSVHTRPETFCSSRTPLACPAFTAVCRYPSRVVSSSQTLFLRADCIRRDPVVAETVLPVVRPFMRVPPYPITPCIPFRLQQMCYPCVVYPASSPMYLGSVPSLASISSSISGIGVTSLMFAASTCTFTITLRLLSTVRCSL